MMKLKDNWIKVFIVSLITASSLLYFFHYLIFRDFHHIMIYLIGDIAFLPAEVLIVTIVIHRLLNEWEKKGRLERLNMVVGAYFTEVGTELLTYLSDHDPQLDDVKGDLIISGSWGDKEFRNAMGMLKAHDYSVELSRDDFKELREYLMKKRNFLLRIIENPNLLEHESFTDHLQAVFHLTEELKSRKSLGKIPDTDLNHLKGDAERVYSLLVSEWVEYMHHLKDNYPYLFSLAMRKNPFDESASIIVS